MDVMNSLKEVKIYEFNYCICPHFVQNDKSQNCIYSLTITSQSIHVRKSNGVHKTLIIFVVLKWKAGAP